MRFHLLSRFQEAEKHFRTFTFTTKSSLYKQYKGVNRPAHSKRIKENINSLRSQVTWAFYKIW